MKHLYFVFFFIGISISAQIKGVVKDSITGKPIPYANIWVENENIGASTEENGEFVINTNSNKNLIFSALGYQKKTLKASQAQVVKLASKSYQLDDVVILKKKETKIF
jgi:isoaspartyl peptidase/L-asparaginase-like protein (Ntn-hydrolase superfamily)